MQNARPRPLLQILNEIIALEGVKSPYTLQLALLEEVYQHPEVSDYLTPGQEEKLRAEIINLRFKVANWLYEVRGLRDGFKLGFAAAKKLC